MKRDLKSLQDFSSKEILELLKVAIDLKKCKGRLRNDLKGKSVGLIFQKPSNRTRVSFEVGVSQLGGQCVYLGPEEINLGKRESTEDVAKTLSRYLDAIVARTFSHQTIVELSQYATIPVINGLSDLFHPCQALADIMSIQEKFGRLKEINIAFIGDGNNVCHSLMLACGKTGANIHVATPKGYEPNADILQQVQKEAHKTGSKIKVGYSPKEAIKGADVVYADVWVSMGQEAEREERLKIFQDYQINQELVKSANPDYIFMHCLPAHRGEEVTKEIIDGKNSVVFDQAENRMHMQKAVLLFLLKKFSK
ncbi:MAG: ornithine carbamoyltransferase [Candidatus Omnitrophica bacterium]|nr:ornithine carbamoyltransferase [Candidatus Omnitrophota bacterium]